MSLLNITEMRRGCFFELGNFSPRKSHQVWKSAIVYIVQRLDLYLPYSRDTTRARTILERAYRCTRLKYRRLNFTKPIASNAVCSSVGQPPKTETKIAEIMYTRSSLYYCNTIIQISMYKSSFHADKNSRSLSFLLSNTYGTCWFVAE